MTVDDVIYDPVTHTSSLPDGTNVPHVTEVLSAVGASTDFDDVAGLGQRIARAVANASARGTAVHADCHAYDDDDLDLDDVDGRALPYVEAWIDARRNLGLVPVARERRLFHPDDLTTGIMDGVFLFDGGKRILGDIKTGDPENAAAHLQTAAYARMWNRMHPDQPIDERWSIWLRPDVGKGPHRHRLSYMIVNYTAHPDAWYDEEKWLACLAVYREQPGRRKERR